MAFRINLKLHQPNARFIHAEGCYLVDHTKTGWSKRFGRAGVEEQKG